MYVTTPHVAINIMYLIYYFLVISYVKYYITIQMNYYTFLYNKSIRVCLYVVRNLCYLLLNFFSLFLLHTKLSYSEIASEEIFSLVKSKIGFEFNALINAF